MTDLLEEVADDFRCSVIEGLAQNPKIIPARFFYDMRGSELFEEITQLPEYYPTRTETALLNEHAADIARLTGRGRPLVEFGAGSAIKTPIVLQAADAPVYVPIDIAGEFLRQSAASLAQANAGLRVIPVIGDFTKPLQLPNLAGPLTGFFPGSTIGNFDHGASVDLLRSFKKTLGDGAHLVIGIDLRKSQRLLEAAYDDAAGVTASFNLNLLHRMNRELGGDIPVEAFEHRAVWHNGLSRIEMHLVATRPVDFTVGGCTFSMRDGETIHTENSYKYTLEETRLLARVSGWEPLAFWTDPDALFGLHVWASARETLQP